MEKFIEKVSTNIPFTDDKIDILLSGKNLILTGANGCGKTSLVEKIHNKLTQIVREKKLDEVISWENSIKRLKRQLSTVEKGSSQYQRAEKQIQHYSSLVEDVRSDPEITINNKLKFSQEVDNEWGVIELFPAIRQSNIQEARSASGTNYKKVDLDTQRNTATVGSKLEQHLVNLYTRRSFSITEESDPELESEITNWLNQFDQNLKFLMEDTSVHMKFDADNFKFYINQDGKLPYTFQNLSSGYSSIFSVFSTLLMRAEYLKISPLKLSGVAIIDEIDAHLHVSLQRKILPFLSNSFPGIQFIVTTHSPFVLTSVSNSEIFDISKREQVGDLSSYSYESVLEGLFDVNSSSDILQNKIREIVKEMESENSSINKLMQLVNDIESDSLFLDEESKFYFNNAKLEIKKYKKGNDR